MIPILKETYGIMLYQEQIMQVVQSLAGFTLGHADIVRRAIGKKKIDIMEKEKVNFINGCKEHSQIAPELAGIDQECDFFRVSEFACEHRCHKLLRIIRLEIRCSIGDHSVSGRM